MAARGLKRSYATAGMTAAFPLSKRQKSEVQEERKHNNLVKSVKKIKKAVAADLHMMNNNSSTTMSSAGVIVYLATTAIGDGNADRTGAAINPLELDYYHNLNIATTGIARMIIFQDSQTYGAAPAVLDVLATATVDSQFNIPNALSKRFRILKDWVHTGVTAQSTSLRSYKGKIKRMNKIMFTGDTNAVASAGRGALYLLRITNLAATQPTDSFSWTLKFNA